MDATDKLEAAIPALRRFARVLLRNDADADDLVQDCLERALPRLGSVRQQADIRPWLFSILHSLHVSRWRRLKRNLIPAGTPEPDGTAPAPQEIQMQMHDVLRGLHALTEDHRAVMMLVAVEGLEYAVAAAVLGIPVGTLMSRLGRARTQLRNFVDGQTHRPALKPVLRSVP